MKFFLNVIKFFETFLSVMVILIMVYCQFSNQMIIFDDGGDNIFSYNEEVTINMHGVINIKNIDNVTIQEDGFTIYKDGVIVFKDTEFGINIFMLKKLLIV